MLEGETLVIICIVLSWKSVLICKEWGPRYKVEPPYPHIFNFKRPVHTLRTKESPHSFVSPGAPTRSHTNDPPLLIKGPPTLIRGVTHSHINNEGVRDGGENLFLVVDVFHLFQSDHLTDGHDLQSREVASRYVFS